jgi:hypothetical protein
MWGRTAWFICMLENKHQSLLSRRRFLVRLGKSLLLAGLLVGSSWGIGILGYHFFEHLSWLDAVLNAAMILTGMGPVNPILTVPGKIFASFYALFSGIVFITTAAVVLTPVAHRVMHRFHLESDRSRKGGEE